MFDIGFWEIVLISVIGLVVLGPERLPHAIRSVMHWVTTAKNMANSVKTEVTQELKLHEINENMIKASKQGLNDLAPELQKSIDEMKDTAEQLSRPYKKDSDDIKTSLDKKPSGTAQQENSILDRSKTTLPTQDKNE